LRGSCLLGEMRHICSQISYPKASLVILEVFVTLAGLDLDLTELSAQAKAMDEQLGELLSRVEQGYEHQHADEEETEYPPPAAEEPPVSSPHRQIIEALFEQAAKDRSKAFELKQELDRLGVFKEYEDRFLDLFKKTD
jgi:uncharacterized coiled-coil protein SlyX